MRVSPYLSYNGQCEAAFKLYEQCLGGQLGAIFRYAGSPLADQAPADWQNKVMHGSVAIGEQVLMGGDVAPDSEQGLESCLALAATGGAPGGNGPSAGCRSKSPRHVTERSPRMLRVASALS